MSSVDPIPSILYSRNDPESVYQRGFPTDDEYVSSLLIGFFFREAKSGVFFRFGRFGKLLCEFCLPFRRAGPEAVEFPVCAGEPAIADCGPPCIVAWNR
jgi:hypothetical protein